MKKQTRYLLGLEIAKCRKQLRNNKQFYSMTQIMRIQHDLHEMEEEMEQADFKKRQRKLKREARHDD